MFKWHGPGGCCCERQYDWYMDEDDTQDTVKFVRVPSVWWPEFEYTDPMTVTESTLGFWEITCTATKEIDRSLTPGYLFTESGDLAAERVWTIESRGVGSWNTLVYYDCVELDELAKYTLVAADVAGEDPDVLQSFVFSGSGGALNTGTWEGQGCGFDATVKSGEDTAVRGFLAIASGGSPSPADGQWITHTYTTSPDTITRVYRTFDLEPMKDGIETGRWDANPSVHPNLDVIQDTFKCPQCIAPRMWPMAAGFHMRRHITEGELIPNNGAMSIYPKSIVYSGEMSCSSGSPGDLTFPDGNTTVIIKNDYGTLTGAAGNMGQLSLVNDMQVLEYDCSPGGYIALVLEEEWTWTGDIDIDVGEGYDFDASAAYYVYLIIGPHGTDSPTPIQKYTSDAYLAHLWGDGTNASMHAIHKHKTDDDYWLFAVPYRATTSSNYSIRCYKISSGVASLHWESPTSTESDIPIILWSSDRWIYVRDLHLSSANVEKYTRDKWDEAHEDWLISHNPEDHPTEADCPYYVPLGVRDKSAEEGAKLGPFWPSAHSILRRDTINNSRLLPHVPPANPF